MLNYITGIHRYATNSGIPGIVAGISIETVGGKNVTILNVVWIDRNTKVAVDQIPLESVLVGHYMITPFEPSVAEIEAIKNRGDEVELNTHILMSKSVRTQTA